MIVFKVFAAYMGVIATSAVAHPAPNNHQDAGLVSDILTKFHQNDYKLKFERVELVRFNKQYLKKLEVVTYKYNRTSPVVNVTWMYGTDLPDYDAVVQAYRFTSNEYRLFPLRFQMSVCGAIKTSAAGLQTLTHCGNFTGCPFLKDVPTRACNWSPDETRFPPFIPDGEYMLEIQMIFRNAELYVLRAYSSIYRPIVKK
ncbi:hypothetical protein ILUMI_08921 [Ignelater luminosus]|uniref:MD-2-related lipid-recognition domain-containing protein n=1 Tax=Ignelater luminosus TaxID=2038154 RepID=A0A8K0D0S2_IGNLU|nr:hypothetical protein ILUMI_08921 [Ignelater luminosus]